MIPSSSPTMIPAGIQAIKQTQKKTIHQNREFRIDKYLEALDIDTDSLNSTVEWMCHEVPINKTKLRLLIIGPGAGRLEVPFVEKLKEHYDQLVVHFIDYSHVSCVELEKVIAAKKWRKSKIDWKIEEKDFENFEYKSNKYDVIVAFFVINFFSDWIAGLKKILCLLHDDGHLFISEDTNDICFLDNTFIPIDQDLEKELINLNQSTTSAIYSAKKDRAIYYRLWREYYSRRNAYGYAWNPLISPSDMGLVRDMFKKMEELGLGCFDSKEFSWKNEKLSWADWIDIIKNTQVFNCLCVIPSLLRKKLASEVNNWLASKVADLDEKPKLTLGHRISHFQRIASSLDKDDFRKISGYVVESKYEKYLFKRLSQHEPYNLETILEETKLEDQIRRLLETHNQLPLKEKIALSVISWKLEDLSDPQKGAWSEQVPIMLPEQFNGDAKERISFCTSYAIYMCLTKYRALNPLDNWYMVSEILIRDLPDNVTINFTVADKEQASIEYNRNGTIRSISICLKRDVVAEIREQAKKICEDAYSCCEIFCGNGTPEKDYLFEYPHASMHWLKYIIQASAEIWKKHDTEITKLFNEIGKHGHSALKNLIQTAFEKQLIDISEWKEIHLDTLAKSLAIIGYANTIVGAGSNNEWSEAVFVPARTFIHQKDLSPTEKVPWEVGLLGFICYFSHQDKGEMTPETKSDWMVIKNLLGTNVNLYSLEDTIQQYTKLIRKEALKSAIAAIMARNMDHLLGSHIETGIAHQMKSFRQEISEIKLVVKDVEEEDAQFKRALDLQKKSEETIKLCYEDDFRINSPENVVVNIMLGLTEMRNKIDAIVRNTELQYSNYRLKRMDLIARFSTEWLPWGVGMSFFNQVMLPFMKNLILLHFLGHGEKLHLRNLDIQVCYPDMACQNCFLSDCTEHRVIIKNQRAEEGFYWTSLDESASSQTFLSRRVPNDIMKLRGGDIGAHAFHIILENILRNSAKHRYYEYCKQPDSDKKMILRIWVLESPESFLSRKVGFTFAKRYKMSVPQVIEKDKEEKPSFWYIAISVNTDIKIKAEDKDADQLAEEVDSFLCKNIITPTGQTDSSVWGMKEKKICSAFLNYKSITETDSNEPDYIGAGTIIWPDGKSRLAYWLKIPKANYLLYNDNKDIG